MSWDAGKPFAQETTSGAPGSEPQDISRLNELGLRFHREQRFDRSLEQFWLSLVRARELGFRDWESVALNNIGMVYQSWGKFDHAMKFYHRSLVISEATGFVQGVIVSLNNLGRLYETWGRLDSAQEHYQRGLALAEAHGELSGKRTTLLNLAMCLEKLGSFGQCRHLVREVVRVDEILQHPNAEMDRAYLAHLEDRP